MSVSGTSHPWSSTLHGTRVSHFDKLQIRPLIQGSAGIGGYQKGIHALPQAPHWHGHSKLGNGIHSYLPHYTRETRGV